MDQAAPEVITEVVPVETAETPVQPTGDTAKPEVAEVKPVVEKTFTQNEVNELIEKRLARDRAKREREQAAARQHVAPVVEQPSNPAAPKREAYEDYEGYIEAKAAYVASETVKADREAQDKATRQAKEQEDRSTALKLFDGQMNAALAKYPDFEDAEAIARTLPISDAMFDAMIRLDEGAELVYFLGKNPAEVHRISQLHPTRQAAEVGRLAAKLASTPAPKPASVSQAPEPIEPIGGKTSAASDKPPENPDEYKRWHDDRERAKRKRT